MVHTSLYAFRPTMNFFSALTNFRKKNISPYRVAEDLNKSIFYSLDNLAPSPFFLFINYMDAHEPYNSPRPFDGYFLDTAFPQLYVLNKMISSRFRKPLPNFWKSYKKTQYDGKIAYLDYHLGKLFSQLKKKKIYNSSLIVITSDHGEMLGERHGRFGHKNHMYEESVRIPLIIKYPFNQKSGRLKNRIALSDIFSTILSICDLPIPEGVSSKPFGDSAAPVVSELYTDGIHRVLYFGKYKFMYYEKNRKYELYDIESDPSEQVNLAETLPEVTDALYKKLTDWLSQHPPQYESLVKPSQFYDADTVEKLKALGYVE